MKPINIAITAACFSGNKGAAAMLQSSIKQLRERYGEKLNIFLMSTYPVQTVSSSLKCPRNTTL